MMPQIDNLHKKITSFHLTPLYSVQCIPASSVVSIIHTIDKNIIGAHKIPNNYGAIQLFISPILLLVNLSLLISSDSYLVQFSCFFASFLFVYLWLLSSRCYHNSVIVVVPSRYKFSCSLSYIYAESNAETEAMKYQ